MKLRLSVLVVFCSPLLVAVPPGENVPLCPGLTIATGVHQPEGDSKALNASPGEYLTAIHAYLQSDERLSDLIPQELSRPVIRTHLTELQERLQDAWNSTSTR